MGRTFDEVEKTDPYRALPEYKPSADPQSVAPELKGQETKLPGAAAQPPTSLSREAREHWPSLPEPVQKFIAEREMQATQKISELSEYAKVAREITQVFEQFSETMPKLADGQAAPPSQVMQHLLAANHALETNPQEALQWLAQSYGVDLGTADTERVRQQAYAEMQQQQQWEQQKQAWEQHQRQTQKVQAHVEAFTRDKPHWDQIEADVLYFIPAEKAKNPHGEPTEWFQAAYDKAMAGRPDLDSTKKAESKRAADQAKRLASLNVKSGGSNVFMKTKGDPYAGMYEIYDRMHGGGRS